MKKSLLLLCASMVLSSANTLAEENLFLYDIVDTKVSEMDSTLHSALKNTYYTVDLHMPIIPSDLSAAVGYEIADGLVEVELYISARVSRFFSDEHDIHLPIGGRIRVPLNGEKTILLEYQREFDVIAANKNGLYETPNMISIIKRSNDSGMFFGCGVGNMIHHAWGDEDHEPQSEVYFECKIGKKFK
ncbi:hypothetical protein A9Q84_13790 [Halobacteriovorax marinus]|uniref:Uncharacterized protein n=1 Tax=Halobacteriovorax marinus TaxID=97084 RepID=A0A1Y5FFK2_9BACT|nr:hypothetical protein A9Q84_13790 [Halobacteriovorax marinus]